MIVLSGVHLDLELKVLPLTWQNASGREAIDKSVSGPDIILFIFTDTHETVVIVAATQQAKVAVRRGDGVYLELHMRRVREELAQVKLLDELILTADWLLAVRFKVDHLVDDEQLGRKGCEELIYQRIVRFAVGAPACDDFHENSCLLLLCPVAAEVDIPCLRTDQMIGAIDVLHVSVLIFRVDGDEIL